MKVRLPALLLSLSLVSIPLYAADQVNNIPIQAKTVAEPINLNTVDLTHLIGSFKGIGKKRAEAIIAYRETHHGFSSIRDLAQVKGIGPHFVEKNYDQLNEQFVIK